MGRGWDEGKRSAAGVTPHPFPLPFLTQEHLPARVFSPCAWKGATATQATAVKLEQIGGTLELQTKAADLSKLLNVHTVFCTSF